MDSTHVLPNNLLAYHHKQLRYVPATISHNTVTLVIKMNLMTRVLDSNIDHDYNDVN